jgi:hypothetical protein
MLVSITNISMEEERNERIEQEPIENDTSIVSSFVHGGFTTSDYDGRPISRSFLHFKSCGNATATAEDPKHFLRHCGAHEQQEASRNRPIPSSHPHSSAIVAAIIGVRSNGFRFGRCVTSHRYDPALPSATSPHLFSALAAHRNFE